MTSDPKPLAAPLVQTICTYCDLPIRRTHQERVRNDWEHTNGMSFCEDNKHWATPVLTPIAEVAAPLPEPTSAEQCDVCNQPLVFPTDGDPTDTWETSICRHTIREKQDAANAEGFYCSGTAAGVRDICTIQCAGCDREQKDKNLSNNHPGAKQGVSPLPEPGNEQRVKAAYPKYNVYTVDNQIRYTRPQLWRVIAVQVGDLKNLSDWKTSIAEAWANAASKLPASPVPKVAPLHEIASASPCPFCGKWPEVGEYSSSDETGERYGYFYVECHHSSNFSVVVHGDSREECVKLWNARAVAAPVPLGEGELPPLDITEDDLLHVKSYGGHAVGAGGSNAALRVRERQLLQSLQREREAKAEAERFLTQAHNAEGNAVFQQRRAEVAEARLRSQEGPAK